MKKTIWDHLLLIILIVLLIIASSCQYEEYEPYIKDDVEKETIDYKKPSYFFKHNLQPQFNIVEIASKFGYSSPKYGQFDTGVAYADFDNDGDLDISYAINDGDDTTYVTHFLALNEGKGEWKDGTYLISNPNFKALSSRKTIVGDFNGDSKPDIVRPTGAHRNYDYPYIMLSNENGYSFKSLGGFERDSHTVSSGDIDNDGDLDLIFSGETSQGILFGYNDGNANFEWEFQLDGLMHAMTSEFIDLNKDGNLDLIISGVLEDDSTGNRLLDGLNIFWGSGNGKFDLGNRNVVWNNNDKHYGGPDDFIITDFNKDGHYDIISLIWNKDFSKIESFKGSSNFSFTNNTSSLFEPNTTSKVWVWLYLNDRDKNGFIDLYDPSQYKGEKFEWNGSKFIRK